jgi:hypothetical protein
MKPGMLNKDNFHVLQKCVRLIPEPLQDAYLHLVTSFIRPIMIPTHRNVWNADAFARERLEIPTPSAPPKNWKRGRERDQRERDNASA